MVDAERGEGRRERRKRLTREAISAAAMRMFAERGFDAVTVSEIAEAADVSEKTVYNYFPREAGLFFDEGDQLLSELLFMLRNRAAGQSALDAVQSFIAGRAEWAAGRRPARPTPQFRRLIAESPALQAARRQMFARYETALAGLLAAETGAAPGSAEPFVAASRWWPSCGPPSRPRPLTGKQLATRQPTACDCCVPGRAATPSPPAGDLPRAPVGCQKFAWAVSCSDASGSAAGHDDQPCPSSCFISSSSGSAAGWSCSAAHRRRRTRSCWCCGTRSPCCAAPSLGPAWTGPTEPS